MHPICLENIDPFDGINDAKVCSHDVSRVLIDSVASDEDEDMIID